MQTFEHLTLDQERALFGLSCAAVTDCTFDGPADGESALKECRELTVSDCTFRLRYPLWHASDLLMRNCVMEEGARAALWYGTRLTLRGCRLGGIKVVRECDGVVLDECTISSDEFAWKSRNLTVQDCTIGGKYAFLENRHLSVSNTDLDGLYPFQYVEDATLDFCTVRAKDALWHAKNVTVTDSILEGEYLGWYSEHLTLKNCVISGTQPFASCKDLTLIDCRMDPGCDRAFERSEVHATLRGSVFSIKNPLHGRIELDGVGELIQDREAAPGSDCVIVVRGA
jgi:hypothetical protein